MPKNKRIQGKLFREYKLRNNYLQKAGYGSYAEYLKSPRWAEIKNRHYAARSNAVCAYCGGKTRLSVHHLEYGKIATDLPDYLITLCDDCHVYSHAIHFAFPDLTIRQASNKGKIVRQYILKLNKKN